MKRGPSHKWTDEEREYVRLNYAHTHASRDAIAAHLGVSPCAVTGQVVRMGLSKQTGRRSWTVAEMELLREIGHKYCTQKIAHMMHRSINSVTVKLKRLNVQRRERHGWYTKFDVMEICGVDHRRVQQWIDAGALKASYHHGERPSAAGARMWHIDEADLVDFLTTYPEELNGRNVDLVTIVALLAGLKDNRCRHHWQLPSNGKVIAGVCKLCGKEKLMPNAFGTAFDLDMTWHKRPCRVLEKAPFRKGIIRNCLIEFENGERMTVPWRALRRGRTVVHSFPETVGFNRKKA